MAVFVINTDITTDTPTIEVTVSPDSRCHWAVTASA